jgi:hypothetical protein
MTGLFTTTAVRAPNPEQNPSSSQRKVGFQCLISEAKSHVTAIHVPTAVQPLSGVFSHVWFISHTSNRQRHGKTLEESKIFTHSWFGFTPASSVAKRRVVNRSTNFIDVCLANENRESCSQGVKRSECEADHSLPSSTYVKNGGAMPPRHSASRRASSYCIARVWR